MAITENTFNGDGSNLGPFSFTFLWLEPTDIKVSVNGIIKTAGTHYNVTKLNYVTRSGGEILFTAGNAPPVGTGNIRVYRETDDAAIIATFNSGSAIRAQDLNENFKQSLYVSQETKAITVAASTGNLAAGSVTSEKLADSAVTTAKVANGAITAAKLSESYLSSAAAASTYQPLSGMSSYLTTAVAAATYEPISGATVTTTSTSKTLANHESCTVTASGQTISLPTSPQPGWKVVIIIAGTFTDTIIARNGANIMSLAENMTIDKGNVAVTLLYVDATRGWRII